MDKTIAGLIGAMTALAAAGASQPAAASPLAAADALQAASYADLFKPIPNALSLLQASDAAATETPDVAGQGLVQTVQYYHHHHHHHRYYRRRYHHHHHHSVARAIIRALPRN